MHEKHLLIADDAAEFADAMLVCCKTTPAQKLGEAGRELYLERFTWPVAWKALENL